MHGNTGNDLPVVGGGKPEGFWRDPAQALDDALRKTLNEALEQVAQLSLSQAGKLLNVSEPTLRKLDRENEIEIISIGRSARIPLSSLRAYIERQREAARAKQQGWQDLADSLEAAS